MIDATPAYFSYLGLPAIDEAPCCPTGAPLREQAQRLREHREAPEDRKPSLIVTSEPTKAQHADRDAGERWSWRGLTDTSVATEDESKQRRTVRLRGDRPHRQHRGRIGGFDPKVTQKR